MSSADVQDRLQEALGGAYAIERELGGGGMSRVFVAEERALGRKVVVKVLPPELAAEVSVERFRRDVQLAASLQHPHVVPVLSAGSAGGLLYYTMPYVEGESLRERLARSGALPVGEALRILRELADVLAYAHRHGVVHRDIKPANVLLTEGHAMVTDFGVAKALSAAAGTDALTATGLAVGTPAYMAPEQATADPHVDHRADIYALGAVAYEMLAGQPPFTGSSSQAVLAAQVTRAPEPLGALRATVPPALAALVMRLLEKHPADRPQNADEVLLALDAASGGAPAIALVSRRTLGRALALYAAAFLAVALLARLAITAIGLPDWVFPGALIVMALGLPVILTTALVHHQARMAHAVSTTASGAAPAPTSALSTLAVRARPHVTWRRTAMGGVSALGTFALLVAGYMLLRTLGIGPAGSLLAAGKLSERERLLVADFRAVGADSALGGVVAEAVRTDLAQSPVVSVVSASAIADALGRMRLPATTRVDLPVARELAQREGIKALVSGDVTRLGGGYLVTMRLVAAESGDELASFHEVADGPRELIPALDALTRRLRGKIGESLKGVRRSPPLERVTTPSLDALRKYAEGAHANDMAEYERAISALEEAVTRDSTFAMAYRKLAVALWNSGGSRERHDWAIGQAYRYRDRLTDRERNLTIAWYHSTVTFDRRQEAVAYEAVLEHDPHDFIATNNLANLRENRREFAAAESLFRRANAASESPISEWGIVRVQIDQGKLSEAAATLDDSRRRFPSASQFVLAHALLLYNQGREDSARAVFERLRRDRSALFRGVGATGLSNLALLHGRLGEWPRWRAEVTAANEARSAPEPPLLGSMMVARTIIWFREAPARGTRMLDSALTPEPAPALQSSRPGPIGGLQPTFLDAAVLYALAGEPQRARAWIARHDARVRDPALRRRFGPRRHEALAELALAEGRPLDAAREFRLSDSLPDGPANDCARCLYIQLGRAYDLAEMPDSAIAMFERYVALPFVGRLGGDAWYLAGVFKRLGELYDGKGDRARAAANYAKFVELWKDADPELQPKVAAARRRLAELSDTERAGSRE